MDLFGLRVLTAIKDINNSYRDFINQRITLEMFYTTHLNAICLYVNRKYRIQKKATCSYLISDNSKSSILASIIELQSLQQ